MLMSIVARIRVAGRPLCAAELAAHLELDEAALEGMLETLVRRGRLRAIVPDEAVCGGCPARGGCFILAARTPTSFALTDGAAVHDRAAGAVRASS